MHPSRPHPRTSHLLPSPFHHVLDPSKSPSLLHLVDMCAHARARACAWHFHRHPCSATPLELPRIWGPPLLALRICVRTHARVLARGILTLPHVRDNSSVSAAPSACTLHTRTCPPFTCCHSHLTTQFATKSRLFFDAAVHASFHWVRPTSLIVPSERIGPVLRQSLPPSRSPCRPHTLSNNFLMCL